MLLRILQIRHTLFLFLEFLLFPQTVTPTLTSRLPRGSTTTPSQSGYGGYFLYRGHVHQYLIDHTVVGSLEFGLRDQVPFLGIVRLD